MIQLHYTLKKTMYLVQVMPRVTVGLVGGSDRVKILEQMQGEEAVAKYDFPSILTTDDLHDKQVRLLLL